MASRITSVVWIKVNGAKQNVKPGSTFNPGGYERAAMAADNQPFVGYTQKPVPSDLECTALHTSATKFSEMSDWAEVSLEVYTDTGKQYLIAGAALAEPPELSGEEGDTKLHFIGPPAQEI